MSSKRIIALRPSHRPRNRDGEDSDGGETYLCKILLQFRGENAMDL